MDPTRRFSSRVENYVRSRPGYPRRIVDLLREGYGLEPGTAIVDVGSGTGALARLFLENGNRVFGVEPNAGMRTAGERLLAGYEGFVSVDGSAEDTTLPDAVAGFVTAGQAFHWFAADHAREEFGRILRPGGRVVLVWNERRKQGTGFLAAYEGLLERHGTDYAEVNHGQRAGAEEIAGFFAPGPVEEHVFDNVQVLDLKGLEGRLLSTSYVPDAGEPGSAEMLDDLGVLFREHQDGGAVTMEYDTRVYVGGL